MASSIDYVPVDIDMLDDPKVSALLDDLSDGDPAARFAAYGRLVLILQRIYHDGFYMRYGKFERRKLAKDAGMAPEELDAFLEACAECEVLDAGMLERGALTSRGIQRRYFRARKAALSSVSEEDAPFVIARAEDCREPPRTSEKRREVPKIAEKRRTIKEKRREVKRSEEEEDARAGAASGLSSSSSLRSLADVPSGRAPLSCLAEVADPSSHCFDDGGNEYDTPWDALAADFAARTRGQPIGPFAAQVAALCPGDCPRDLGHVEACARLLRRAVARYDPAKGSLFPLARKIIEDERGDPR